MKFDTQSKIWECVSKDISRPVLTHVHLLIKDTDAGREGWLEATNTFVLVRIPVELTEDDTAGLVPVDALKSAAKAKGELSCNGTCTDLSGRSWPRPEGQFPDSDCLMAADSTGEYEGSCTFGVSAVHLASAAKAMGAQKGGVKLTVGSPLRPIRVEALGGVPGAQCVLMPIRVG